MGEEEEEAKLKKGRRGGKKTSLHYNDVIVSYFTVRLVTTELWASAKLFSKAISSSPYEKKSMGLYSRLQEAGVGLTPLYLPR